MILVCLLQCHYSYSDCGLGSDGTDRLVKLVQEIQHRPSRDGQPSLLGAKITGGGSGGTVCVIGRNCIRSSEEILEVTYRWPELFTSSRLTKHWFAQHFYHLFLVISDTTAVQSSHWSFTIYLWGFIPWCWKVWLPQDTAKDRFISEELSSTIYVQNMRKNDRKLLNNLFSIERTAFYLLFVSSIINNKN